MALAFRESAQEAWLWLLSAFVFFLGIANGMLAWAATFRVAQARWTPAVNRIGHSAIAFAPVLLIGLIALMFGVRSYVPWVTHPIPVKAAWLNVPFMVIRDIASFLVLWILFGLLVRWSLRADTGPARCEAITSDDQFRLTAIATAAVITYTFAATILAYDLIMSLSPTWSSTMFAPYIWITSMYSGMAMLIVMSAILRRPLGVEEYLSPKRFQDMGNLLLGFSLFSMGLFFAQYLTIWYENLPDETPFLIVRYYRGEWPCLGWAAFIVGLAIPFVLLQSRYLKQHPMLLSAVSVMVLAGTALDRYVLVVPSVRPSNLLLFPAGILVYLGFAGLFVLAVTAFLARYPAVSSADLALREADREMEAVA